MALQSVRTAQECKSRLLDALRIHGGKPYMAHNKNDVLLNRQGACSARARLAQVVVAGGGQHRVTDKRSGVVWGHARKLLSHLDGVDWGLVRFWKGWRWGCPSSYDPNGP